MHGTSFFSPKSNLGLSYKASGAKTLSASIDGVEYDPKDDPLMWKAGAFAAYQIPTSSAMFAELGVGAEFSSQSVTDSGVTLTVTEFSVAAYGEINYSFKTNNMFLNAGVSISYPLGGTVSGSVGGVTSPVISLPPCLPSLLRRIYLRLLSVSIPASQLTGGCGVVQPITCGADSKGLNSAVM